MKKGFLFSISLAVVSLVVLISAYIVLQKAREPLKERIGERQFQLIDLYQEGDAIQFFVEQSAKYAGLETALALARNGGFAESSDCDNHLGYQLWKGGNEECFPSYSGEFRQRFLFQLGDHLVSYPGDLPLDYSSDVIEDNPLTLMSYARTSISLGIDKQMVAPAAKAQEPQNVPQAISNDQKGLMQSIYNYYGSTIKLARLNFPNVDEALIAATIAQESRGSKNAISATGCAGLLQFCYKTATDYRRIFGQLTACDCTGQLCQIRPLCNENNDGRFDADKSIKAAVDYYNWLLARFYKYSYKLEFAIASYNVGYGVVESAIKATGKKDPSWQDVSASLRPEQVTYFSSQIDQIKKIDEVRKYVPAVMGYMQEYKLLAHTIMQEQYESSKEDYAEPTHDCCICQQSCGYDCRLEAIPEGQACGPWSVGRGKNCGPDYCAAPTAPSAGAGTYEFTPRFRTLIDYDISDYVKVEDTVLSQLLPEVSTIRASGTALEQAVKAVTALLSADDFKWSFDRDCDTPPEKVFNTFVEGCQLCAESQDTNCVCEFSMDFGKNLVPDGSFEIRISNASDGTSFDLTLPEGLKISQWLPYETYIVPRKTFPRMAMITTPTPRMVQDRPEQIAVKHLRDKSFKYYVKYDKGSFSTGYMTIVELGEGEWTLAMFPEEEQGTVRMYRNDRSELAFLSEDDYQNQQLPYGILPKCSTNKRVYRFCATRLTATKDPKMLLAANPLSGKLEMQDLTYRFALSFP